MGRGAGVGITKSVRKSSFGRFGSRSAALKMFPKGSVIKMRNLRGGHDTFTSTGQVKKSGSGFVPQFRSSSGTTHGLDSIQAFSGIASLGGAGQLSLKR